MPWPRHPSMRTSRSSRASTPRCSRPCSSAAAPAGKPPVRCSSIAPTGRRAESLGPALEALLPGAEVLHFPAWETLPHERLSPSPETVGTRLDVLGRIARWTGETPLVVTASVRGALQPLAAGLADVASRSHLAVGGRGHDLAEVSARLVELAYHRVDMVSRRGEFALRGGILDVFPPTRRPPVPRRVLRRRGRPDPRVLGRRPAVAARRGARRSTLRREPRAAAHRGASASAHGS